MTDFYLFTREIDSSDYIYTFLTNNKLLYSVEFQGSTYQEYSAMFPSLMIHGYGLVITCQSFDKQPKKKYDGKVKNTIGIIISSYFALCGNGTILLYHCDTSDGMQRHRNITFSQWFNYLNVDNEYLKESFPFDYKSQKMYLGYIASKHNQNIETIQNEFNAFSYEMSNHINSK